MPSCSPKAILFSDISNDISKDLLDDSMMDVESGIEALEESHADILDIPPPDLSSTPQPPNEPPPPYIEPITTSFSSPPNKNNSPKMQLKSVQKARAYFFNFFMALLTVFLLLSYALFPNADMWNGFLLGLWIFNLLAELKQWVLDTYFCEWDSDKNNFVQNKKTNVLFNPVYTIPSVKEHRPLKKYEVFFLFDFLFITPLYH